MNIKITNTQHNGGSINLINSGLGGKITMTKEIIAPPVVPGSYGLPAGYPGPEKPVRITFGDTVAGTTLYSGSDFTYNTMFSDPDYFVYSIDVTDTTFPDGTTVLKFESEDTANFNLFAISKSFLLCVLWNRNYHPPSLSSPLIKLDADHTAESEGGPISQLPISDMLLTVIDVGDNLAFAFIMAPIVM